MIGKIIKFNYKYKYDQHLVNNNLEYLSSNVI